MVPELEKPRVTEIKVRMDCNGCVQKVKKALHGITGIYDIYIDFPEQKITIIGWADPVKIARAIRKTRKSAVICSHTEQSDQPPPQEPGPEGVPEGGAPPPESNNPQTTEHPQTEGAQADGQNEETQPPPPENPLPEEKPVPEPGKEGTSHPVQPSRPKDLEEIHVIYHHPPDYGYRYAYGHYHQPRNAAQWNGYPSGPGIRAEPPQPAQQVYATHSYNTHRPSAYVTEYAYPLTAPGYSHYSRPEHYSQVYYNGNAGNGNGSITSIFSEENPNACSIV